MKKYQGFYVILLLLIISCHKNNHPNGFHLDDFRIKKTLFGTPYALNNTVLPIDICVIPEKNVLLITDIKDRGFWVHVYRLGDLAFIKSFVEKGASPNQQIGCGPLQYSSKQGLLYISDFYKKKIFTYDINDIADAKRLAIPISDVTLLNKSFYKPLILSNNTIFDVHRSDGEVDKALMNFYQFEGKLVSSKGQLPYSENDLTFSQRAFAYLAGVNISKQEDKIIFCYLHTDYIDLYNIKGGLIRRVQGPEFFSPSVITAKAFNGEMTMLSQNALKAYESKPCMFGDNIYVLFNGEKDSPEYHVNTVFNFSGNLTPKTIYTLNKPICSFDIDHKTNILYGITHRMKGFNLIKYKLL